MTAERYRKIAAWFGARRGALRLLKALNKALPLLFYGLYPLLLVWLLLRQDARLMRLTALPAGAFLTCTVLRPLLHAPRPAEALGITPLLPKRKAKRDSFPSRHLTCASVIAAVFGAVSPPLGCILAAAAVLMAAARVLAGVHFPRDVIAGALLGAAFGAFAFLPF